jgi:hypothetical protein
VQLRRLVDIFAFGLYLGLYTLCFGASFRKEQGRKCWLHHRSAKIKPLLDVDNKKLGVHVLASHQVKSHAELEEKRNSDLEGSK